MSITINGTTNTLTAASGLTIAGNTAVTGTLSATGVTDASRFKPTGAPSSSEAGLSLYSSGFWLNTPSGTIGYLGVNGSGVAAVSSTGLAVTGTLSASGVTSVTDTTDATSTTAASLKTAGGLGVAKKLYVGGSTIRFDGSIGNGGFLVGPSGEMLIGEDSTALYIGTGIGGLPAIPIRIGSTATTTQTFRAGGGDKVVISGSAVTLSSGVNLVMASGQGIDFSATSNGSGTTTSEVLSDYEEGTWTPVLTFGGGSTGITYSEQSARYTKIGRNVTIAMALVITAKGSSTGAAVITGLPFTSGAQVFDLVGSQQAITATGIVGRTASTATLALFGQNSGTGYTTLTDAEFTNNSGVFINATYTV